MSAESLIKCNYREHTKERIVQGDILQNITFYLWDGFKDGEIELKKRFLPYIVILTQDCDLKWDFKKRNDKTREDEDKYLLSILVCPAYEAEYVRTGTHLAKLNMQMQRIPSKEYKKVRQNDNPRYHFLKKDLERNIPELIVDFKHYYTTTRNILYELYDTHFLASMNELFREDISQRFTAFLSRVGVPEFD